MKLELTNPNYNCTVVRINKTIELEGCDNVCGFPMFGLQAIVSKDIEIGSLYLLFSVEVEINQIYLSTNNLFRDSTLNKNPEAKGYCETHRRVKAIKFRGHKSSALLMPLSSLSYLGDTSTLKEGDSFNTINGIILCQKYVAPMRGGTGDGTKKIQKKARITKFSFPEHLDSANYWRSVDKFRDADIVVVTQKLHGRSARIGNILVEKDLSFMEKILQKLGVKIESKEYDNVYASRRVIHNDRKLYSGFYQTNVWSIINHRYHDLIPKDWIIYGEIIGWDGDKPMQKLYTYGLPKGECEFYVYRISICNQDGVAIDLSWEGIKKFCDQVDMQYCPEVWKGEYKNFDVVMWMNRQLHKEGIAHCIPLSDNNYDEGVIVRREGIIPFLTKAKCSKFLEYESKILDEGESDLESVDII